MAPVRGYNSPQSAAYCWHESRRQKNEFLPIIMFPAKKHEYDTKHDTKI